MHILIASFNVGAGHAQAAKAIQAALNLEHPDLSVELLDVFQCLPWIKRQLFSTLYLSLIRLCPELWGMAFKKTDDHARWRARSEKNPAFARMTHRRLLRLVSQKNPAVLVCTHFLHLDLFGREFCRPRKRPLACVITDFEAHASWVSPHVDRYFVATDRVRQSLAYRSIPIARVQATGIPIHPQFSCDFSKAQACAKFGLDLDKPVVAVLGGGLGLGPMENVMRELDLYSTPLQVVGAAGKNEKLQKRLSGIMQRQSTKVLGFLDNMHELLRAADLIITKPGGLTSSEALARQCPMLLINPIPGQEAGNSDFLLEHGVAAKANRITDLRPILEEMLDSRLTEMQQACRILGRPRAAFEVANTLASLADHPQKPEVCLV